jgi:hypothetical protein
VADIENPDPLAAKTEMMFMVHCDAPGVERTARRFPAWKGTNTWAVRLTITLSVKRADRRPGALPGRHPRRLHPAANRMAWRVTQGAIDLIDADGRTHAGPCQRVSGPPDDLQAELDDLTARIMQLAKTLFRSDNEFVIDVLDVRPCVRTGLRSAQSVLLHQGARG